jgi:hypothetical protein
MHLLGFYIHVVFEALYAHLSYKVNGFFSTELMIKYKQINFKEKKLDMFEKKQS